MSQPGPHAGDTAATFCATLVDTWVGLGVRHVVVSPGSRSTPLALAVAADARVAVHVHHDERAAAFMALGIGAASGVPAVVVTTSGTAAVELHPAVVEAHEAGVAMVVCTADRPPWLHGVGAPQTVDQHELYGTAVRLFAEPGVPDPADAGSWRALAAGAFTAAVGSPPGPVHLNLAFDEPLVGTAEALPPDPGVAVPPAPGVDDAAAASAAACATRWASRTGVIVAGGGIADPGGVLALAHRLGWPVLADPRSGTRVPDGAVVAHFDALLRHDGFAAAAVPEVVVRLGSLPASKVLGTWLNAVDVDQVGVDTHGRTYDPGRSLGAVVACEPGAWCAAVAAHLGDGGAAPPAWTSRWRDAEAAARAVLADRLDTADAPTEPAVARAVAAAVPDGTTLVVSSSMPVRDVEWFAGVRTGLTVVSNRGANGIDGVVSTAVGVALATGDPVTCLVGDVALLHDTNALLGLARRGCDVTVVVVDNDGGGIFSFLPQATAVDAATFERLYGTPHGVDLVALAAAHGVHAEVVGGVAALRQRVANPTGQPRVVVVRTDRAGNPAVHDAVHAAVAAAVGGSVDAAVGDATGA